MAKKYADNPDLSAEIGELLDQTKHDAIDVYINLGSIYMTQTNYQHALREADAALAIDPKSASVKSFRARVASASADSGIFVYGRRR